MYFIHRCKERSHPHICYQFVAPIKCPALTSSCGSKSGNYIWMRLIDDIRTRVGFAYSSQQSDVRAYSQRAIGQGFVAFDLTGDENDFLSPDGTLPTRNTSIVF